MTEEKHLIWGNIDLSFEDRRDDLKAEYPEKSEDELYMLMHETNGEYLGDERLNLNIQLDGDILVIADLGLWHGRVMGYHIIESGNIKDCLYTECDMAEWYVDQAGEFRCRAIHHDGTNYYRYREVLPNMDGEELDDLCDKIYRHKVTEADIDRVTQPIGRHIAAVYGWDLQPPTPPPKQQSPRAYER